MRHVQAYSQVGQPCGHCIQKSLDIKHKRDEEYAPNITLRLIRSNIVAMEKQCVTYSECVFVAIRIQHAMHVRHIVISSLSGFTVFFYIIP